MSDLGHNGGPSYEEWAHERMSEEDQKVAMAFARFHINDILKTVLQMRNLEHRGFFLTALIVMYDRGGCLPADDRAAANSLCMDVRTYRRLKAIMVESNKLRDTEDGLTNDRVQREIADYCAWQKSIREKRSKSQQLRRQRERDEALPAEIARRSGEDRAKIGRRSAEDRPDEPPHLFQNVNEINDGLDKLETTLSPSLSLSLSPIESKKDSPEVESVEPLSEIAISDDGDELVLTSPPEAGAKPPPRRPRARQVREYSVEFAEFWNAYPDTTNNSKSNAFAEWAGLTPGDQRDATASLPAFAAYCRSQRDYRVIHAERYLKYRRFEGFAQKQAGAAAPWWSDPAKLAATTDADWRRLIAEHANGRWPLFQLGPPPGTRGCIVPQRVSAELRLEDRYDDKGIARDGSH